MLENGKRTKLLSFEMRNMTAIHTFIRYHRVIIHSLRHLYKSNIYTRCITETIAFNALSRITYLDRSFILCFTSGDSEPNDVPK